MNLVANKFKTGGLHEKHVVGEDLRRIRSCSVLRMSSVYETRDDGLEHRSCVTQKLTERFEFIFIFFQARAICGQPKDCR